MMKRVLSILLTLCLMLTFTACGGEETPAPEEPAGIALPFGLTFGMTYDEFAAKLSEHGLTAPALKPASNNDSFVIESNVSLYNTDAAVWKFTGSDLLQKLAAENITLDQDPDLCVLDVDFSCSLPDMFASFNQNKELYEIYVSWYLTADEEFPRMLTTELSANYKTFFGTVGEVTDTTGRWETEEYSVQFGPYEDSASVPIVNKYLLVIHDKTHNLDAWLAN